MMPKGDIIHAIRRIGDVSKQRKDFVLVRLFFVHFYEGIDKMIYDAVVIGAGVVGSMTARELTRYGLKVCVVDREPDAAMGATKANSAIVHAGFDAKEGSLKAKLNVEGSCLMGDVAKELGVKYIQNGSLVVAFDDDDRKTINELYERGNTNGVKNLKIIEKDGVFTVTSPGESIQTKIVINAAGIYSDKIAEIAGDNSFNITARRGEYILLDKAAGISTIFVLSGEGTLDDLGKSDVKPEFIYDNIKAV